MQPAHLLAEVPTDCGKQLLFGGVGADVRQLVKAPVPPQSGCVQPLQVYAARCCLPLRCSPLQVVIIRICSQKAVFQPDARSHGRGLHICCVHWFLKVNESCCSNMHSPAGSGSDCRAGRRDLAVRCCGSPAFAYRVAASSTWGRLCCRTSASSQHDYYPVMLRCQSVRTDSSTWLTNHVPLKYQPVTDRYA